MIMRCVTLAVVLLAATASGYAAVDYARDVQPIFASRCYACHGPQTSLGGLRLDDASRAAAVKDKLITRITSADPKVRMPLGGAPLKADQIASIKAWVEQTPPSKPTARDIW